METSRKDSDLQNGSECHVDAVPGEETVLGLKFPPENCFFLKSGEHMGEWHYNCSEFAHFLETSLAKES